MWTVVYVELSHLDCWTRMRVVQHSNLFWSVRNCVHNLSWSTVSNWKPCIASASFCFISSHHLIVSLVPRWQLFTRVLLNFTHLCFQWVDSALFCFVIWLSVSDLTAPRWQLFIRAIFPGKSTSKLYLMRGRFYSCPAWMQILVLPWPLKSSKPWRTWMTDALEAKDPFLIENFPTLVLFFYSKRRFFFQMKTVDVPILQFGITIGIFC